MLGSGLGIFWSASSVLVVFGGTIAAACISSPMDDLQQITKITKNAFTTKATLPGQLMRDLKELVQLSKKTDKFNLPKLSSKFNIPFLHKGLQYLADGTKVEIIRRNLQSEIYNTQQRHKLGRDIFVQMSKSAPAFGMIGTLIGLVQMLSGLSDPASIGPKMAIALLTTFYGAVIANLVFIPIANKLKRRSECELFNLQVCYETIMHIYHGDPVLLLEDKFTSFISHQMKSTIFVDNSKPIQTIQATPKTA